MSGRCKIPTFFGDTGFTLLEVMVSLIVGTLIVGAVMGLISVSLQYTQRVKEKAQVQPILEAAAQEILADPKKALNGSLTLGGSADAPIVGIALTQVEGLNVKTTLKTADQLFRIVMTYRGHILEFSILIPQSAFR
jgi:prepilin-type N-terminal cleavage/methylation domain-containing protein